MNLIKAEEVGNRIMITISIQEKKIPSEKDRSFLELPRFKAASKQLLSRCDRPHSNYNLVEINRDSAGPWCGIYTFVWVKKNE